MFAQFVHELGQNFTHIFTVNLRGRDLARGKPELGILLLASEELNMIHAKCIVVEDAPAEFAAGTAG